MRLRARLFAVLTLVLASLLLGPTHPAAASYTGIHLPYPNGTAYNVNQTPGVYETCPGPSHCSSPDNWAYDFGLATGNWTSAVHTGTVIRWVFGNNTGGCDISYAIYANFVVLDHGDGYSSIYYHLQYNSAVVSANQFVYQGHPLGGADTTGWVCGSPGTHLHWAVETTPPTGSSVTQSVQASFDEAGEPAANTAPTSANRKQFSAQYLSGSAWVTLSPGQLYTAIGQWKNTGYDQWAFNVAGSSARLGTWSPTPGQDQPSQVGGAVGCPGQTNWLSCTRIRPTTDTVDPDQTGWFQFDLIGPPTSGVYQLYVRPVIEGVIWMEDYGVFWQVTVP
jgi:peptidase M23-like protein